MRKAYMMFAILVAFVGFVVAAEDVSEGKQLVESKADCSTLSDSQLEAIGEYYMEQMHPGESHELMDAMMGGEGSESLRQVHISMAESIYCQEQTGSAGMMGSGMMGSGGMPSMMRTMMGGSWQGAPYGMTGYGYPNLFGWSIFDLLLLVLLVGLIVAVYLHIWDKVKKQKRVNR